MAIDREWLAAQKAAGRTDADIGAELGIETPMVGYYRRRHGIPSRGRSEIVKAALKQKYPSGRRGSLAANWKGGRMSTTGRKPGGYIRIYKPDHIHANKSGYIYEHRWVMEQKIGRPVKPEEVVDHIDRNRSNNHPDNLRLHENRSRHVKDHYSARDQLVALVGRLRAIRRWRQFAGQVLRAEDVDRVCDEALAAAGLEAEAPL